MGKLIFLNSQDFLNTCSRLVTLIIFWKQEIDRIQIEAIFIFLQFMFDHVVAVIKKKIKIIIPNLSKNC